ncbi:haloalkane dehalogenase [Allobranchiibius sp. GilTou73]|uniref:haloalkane dehalogenase n=1 Tax=Allobranchiibius sp. GilTou73 TaxID=2904523 RepID=UPI001F199E16|nr:haloalkane dehalogenase [Allobranchiibius sp. GilTou73]UIJ35301.1 haloalkane dehalogenase [Allobranchiibius sp. GilTou73]
MEVYRTPDAAFAQLPDFPWEPAYAQVADPDGGTMRMAYVDVGPVDGPVALLLHGEPSWSFLYRQVIRVLADHGIRCVAPDLIGFGRSDKPLHASDYSYARLVEWTRELVLEHLQLREITLVGQDWGGLIGLRLLAEHPDRFVRVVAANTGLPTGDVDMPEVWWRFRRAVEKAQVLDIGRLVDGGCARPMTPQVRAAYDAPFPDERAKAGPRAMPGLVPTRPDDPASDANRAAWLMLSTCELPFLLPFSDADPITAAMAPILRRHVPGARDRSHPTIERAGHFLQEDAGPELGQVITQFMQR